MREKLSDIDNKWDKNSETMMSLRPEVIQEVFEEEKTELGLRD